MGVIKEVTFKDIQTANESINTTKIKGKEYAEVDQRIKAFRSLHPSGQISSEILSNEKQKVIKKNEVEEIHVCIIKTTVCDADGNILGTGTAYERENSSFINTTSYIENCETSAIGRALGVCGFGINTSIASAEEVQNAQLNQGEQKTDTQPNAANQNVVNYGKQLADVLAGKGLCAKTYGAKYGLNKDTSQEELEKHFKMVAKLRMDEREMLADELNKFREANQSAS